MKCSQCHTEILPKPGKTDRLPKGWKRSSDVFCNKCWQERYILRAITLPIVGPCNATWPEFREALEAGWADCTAASNWLLTEMYARDVRRDGQVKLPPMPKVYLYPEARAKFPRLPSQTIASLEHAIAGKYRAKRYAILWTCAESLPNYRYPAPMIVPSQGWKASYEHGQRPVIAARIGERRFTLRLRGGKEFYRQLIAFKQIVCGEAVAGELAIYRQRSNAGDHRNGVSDRNGGGIRQPYRIMAKLVAWLPRAAEREQTGTLFLSNDAESLLFAVNAKANRVWSLHFDHVKRWIAEHAKHMQHWSDDSKMEVGRGKRSFASRREAAGLKYRNRMQSAVKEAASQVVKYAARCKFAKIVWAPPPDCEPRKFQWAMLLERIATKCNELGILFEIGAGGKTPAKEDEIDHAETE
jgi:hypothetical protein